MSGGKARALWPHLVAATASRLLLAWRGIGEVLQRRIEIATPVTSLERLRYCPIAPLLSVQLPAVVCTSGHFIGAGL